jgi:methylmalonyl-CoA mutase cobalamin-binding domain/chain
MSDIIKQIYSAIYDGEEDLIAELAEKAIAEGLDANTVINEGGVAALTQLGEEFDRLEVFLPELMMAGEAMKVLVDTMAKTLKSGEEAYKGKVIIGTAKGDLHDIGMNLVAIQLSVHGYEVFNLGPDNNVGKYIDKAKEVGADIIAVSSLLTTSAYYQGELVERLEKEGLRDTYKVIVGGGPITPEWTRKIRADGYSRTANLAVKLCNELVANKSNPKEPIIIE